MPGRGRQQRVSSAVLVGRDEEIAALRAALADVRAGGFRAVLVRGEAGIGKSRLVREFLAREAGDSQVLVGHSAETAGLSMPFGPLVDALGPDPQMGLPRAVLDETNPDARLVRHLLGATAATSSPAGGSPADLGTGRAVAVLVRMLALMAAERPLVFVVEDLQWSDPSTRELLLHLARTGAISRLLLILTIRTEQLAVADALQVFVGEISRTASCEVLTIRPLGLADTVAQLAAITGTTPDREWAERIHERSDGNPFHTEELAAAGDDVRLPPDLSEMLLNRFVRLAPGTQELLRLAAVLGRSFSGRMLAATQGARDVDVEHALRDASRGQVLLLDEPEEGRHSFRHALLHEAIYNDLLASERTRAHLAIVRALEDAPELEPRLATRMALLAHHALAAGDQPTALRASVAAAMAADDVFAHRESLQHYELAIALCEGGVTALDESAGHDLASLYERAAAAAALVLNPSRAIELANRAVGVLDADTQRVRLGLVYERLGFYHWLAASHAESVEAAAMAVELIPARPASEALARALAGYAMVLMVADDERAEAVARQAIQVARAVGDHRDEASALGDLGCVLGIRGPTEEAVACLRDAYRIASDHRHWGEATKAAINLTWLLISDGRYREAAAVAAEGYEVAREYGLQDSMGIALTENAIEANYQLGEWQVVEELLRRAVTALESMRPADSLIALRIHHTSADIAMARGDFAAARRHLIEMRTAAGTQLLPNDLAQAARSEATFAVWMHELGDARRHVDAARETSAGEPSERLRVRQVGLRAEADAIGRVTRRARARRMAEATLRVDELIAEARAVAAEVRDRDHLRRLLTLCELEHRRFLAEADVGMWSTLAKDWATLAAEFEANQQRADALYVRWRAAEAMLKGGGPRPETTAYLTSSIELSRELGAQSIAIELERLARRARVRLRHQAPGNDSGLTPREFDVLELVAAGMTNRDIARRLFIAEKTAGIHVSNVLGKLGVTNRTEAAATALRQGLIPRPD